MSMPTIPQPIKNPAFFQYKYTHAENGGNVYKLDVSELSPHECHLFFPPVYVEEMLTCNLLEFITFNPAHKVMNDKYNITPVLCDQIYLLWCRFPIEFKDVCERAAKIFEITVMTKGRIIATEETTIEFPHHSNLMFFQGNRHINNKNRDPEFDDNVWIGNFVEKQGVD